MALKENSNDGRSGDYFVTCFKNSTFEVTVNFSWINFYIIQSFIPFVLINVVCYHMAQIEEIAELYIIGAKLAYSIVAYFCFLKKIFAADASQADGLNVVLLELPLLGKMSIWPLSHVVFHTLLGANLKYHSQFVMLHQFVIGAVWELVEYIFKRVQTGPGEVLKFKRSRNAKTGQIDYEQWWSSSSKDFVYNSAGIMIGWQLREFLKSHNLSLLPPTLTLTDMVCIYIPLLVFGAGILAGKTSAKDFGTFLFCFLLAAVNWVL